jgi:hypothetical protein
LFGSRLTSILHTRLRQNCSSLKGDVLDVIWSILVTVTATNMWKTMTTTSCTVNYWLIREM